MSTLKSSLLDKIFDKHQICQTESRESSQIPSTEQAHTNTYSLCTTSPIAHSLSKNGVVDAEGSSASPRSSQDIDGKDCHIPGYRLSSHGDYAGKPKASVNGTLKIVSGSDEAEPETKDDERSREAVQKPGSPYTSDLDPEHKNSDSAHINNPTDQVLTTGLQKFEEIFDGCFAEERFNSDPNKCLLNTKKGQRCGGKIPGNHKEMIREVLASLANLYIKGDEQECIHQLGSLVDLAVCKRNHREAARRLIDSLLQDHGASIIESVMGRAACCHAGASGSGTSTTSFKKQNVIPDDMKKEIRDVPNGRDDGGGARYDFRTPRATTLKKGISYLPNFLPYKQRGATKSSTTECLKKQISKPLLPSDIASGWLYVYWNRANFGFVKIGYTNTGVDQRLKKWTSQCKHDAVLLDCSDRRIPHVRRLEHIVHAEVKDFRYYERNCPGCHRNHDEWFQLPSNLSREEIISKWTKWMLTEPYEEIQGVWQLKPHYAEKLDDLGKMLQVREPQEVNKTAVAAKQKESRIWASSRRKDGRLKAKSKPRQINRVLN